MPPSPYDSQAGRIQYKLDEVTTNAVTPQLNIHTHTHTHTTEKRPNGHPLRKENT